MTKLHEQIFRGSISEILEDIKKEKILLKGEIVIVVEGAQKNNINNYILDKNTKKEFLKKLSASDAAKLISLITGQNKRDVYKNLIEI
jgi:16S rRNA (cytidine1402-2'-O)-methyltransferase